ncbi:MAG: hypothetical protein WC581_11990 [Thermodesulfovibrionales bacterium]
MKKVSIYNFFLILPILILLSIQSVRAEEIFLGTSGGNINDVNRTFCCSGTLGALVHDINYQYILSNNHVLAMTNTGVIGDDIIQPGLIDQSPVCYQDTNDVVADLSDFVPISFTKRTINLVDAAIAKVRIDKVNSSGSILNIGPVSISTVPPTINMEVQKNGRTTGLTTGTVTAVDVTVRVSYNKTCGKGSQTATFTNQFIISSAGFSAGGDSGSLIVENCSPYPRAVGLLFAGSNTTTVANPINNVLSGLSVSMVGVGSYCTVSTTGIGNTSMTKQLQLPPQANERAKEAVRKVKERHEESILDIDGVVGVGIGLSETVPGQVVIEVYTKKPTHQMSRVIPETLESIPVKMIETGEIIAF